jgi:hypothetical protein
MTISSFVFGQEKFYESYKTESGMGIRLTDFNPSTGDDVRVTIKEYDFIDRFVIPENERGISKTYVRFRENGKMGIMNVKGKEIIPAVYDTIKRFGRWADEMMPLIPEFFLFTKDKRSWLKTVSGLKDVLPESVDSVSYDCITGDYCCFENNRVTYFCNNGKQLFPDIEFEVIARVYSEAYRDDEYHAPIAIIAKEPGKSMSVYSAGTSFNNNEEAILHYFVPEWDDNLVKLLVVASKTGKKGLLDEQGTIRIPFLYDSLIPIIRWYDGKQHRLIITFLDGKEGLCDFHNQTIYPPEYMPGSFSENATYYNEGLFIVMQGNSSLQGVLSVTGKEIIPLTEQTIKEHLHNSYYDKHFFYVKRNGKTGVYDTEGTEIIPCEYYEIYDENVTKSGLKTPKFVLFNSQKEYLDYWDNRN